MNEEAIRDAYNLFVGTGYNKSYEDFKQLIKSNPQALQDAFGLFANTGYNKDINSFKTLMGVDGSMSQQEEELKKKEDMGFMGQAQDAMSGTMASQSADSSSDSPFPSLPSNKDLLKLPSETTQMYANIPTKEDFLRMEKEIEQGKKEELLPDFVKEKLNSFDAMLISKGEFREDSNNIYSSFGFSTNRMMAETGVEEAVVPKMNYMFGPLGFKFEESGMTGDYMKVIAPNKEEIEISLNNLRFEDNIEETKALKDFIAYNATQIPEIEKLATEYSGSNTRFSSDKELEDYSASIAKDYEELNKTALLLSNDIKKFESDVADFNSMPANNTNEYFQKKAILESTLLDINARRESVLAKNNTFQANKANLDRAVGKYSDMKAEQGTWGGATYTWLGEGVSNTLGGLANLFLDLGSIDMTGDQSQANQSAINKSALKNDKVATGNPEEDAKNGGYIVDVTMRLNQYNKSSNNVEDIIPEPKEGQSYKDWYKSLSADQQNKIRIKIEDDQLKRSKEIVLPPIREGVRGTITDSNTSVDWRQLAEEGFWGGAYASLIKSAPAMVAPGGWAGRTAAFYGQSSDAVAEEMSKNPAFDEVPESEKLKVIIPIGIANAVLEEVGLSNLINSKGFINSLVVKAMTKAGVNTTETVLSKIIKNDVESMLARGALTLGSAALAEAETGAGQQIAEYAVKDIYNLAKEKEMFDTPDSMKEYVYNVVKAGAQEAVGGMIMGTPGSVSAAYRKRGYEGLSDDEFKTFESIANDDKIQSAYIATLKTKVAGGELTSAEAKEQLNDYRKSVGLYRSIDTELSTEAKKKAMNLVREKQVIEERIKDKDGALVKKQKDRITEINVQLTKLSEEATQEEVAPESAPAESKVQPLTEQEQKRKTELEGHLQYKEMADRNGVTEFTAQDSDGNYFTLKYADAQAELDALNSKTEVETRESVEAYRKAELEKNKDILDEPLYAGSDETNREFINRKHDEYINKKFGEKPIEKQAPPVLSTAEATTSALEALPEGERSSIKFMQEDGTETPVMGNEKMLADLFQEAQAVPEDQRTDFHQNIIDAVNISLADQIEVETLQQPTAEPGKGEQQEIFGTAQNAWATINGDVVDMNDDFFNGIDDNKNYEFSAYEIESVPQRFRSMVTKDQGRGKRDKVFGLPIGKKQPGEVYAYKYTLKGSDVKAYRNELIEYKGNRKGFTKAQIFSNTARSLASVFPKLKITNFKNADDMKAYAQKFGTAFANQFLGGEGGVIIYDAKGKPSEILTNDEVADATTLPHEAWHAILIKAFGENEAMFKEFRDSIRQTLIKNGYQNIVNELDTFSSSTEYQESETQGEEWMAQLGGLLTASGMDIGNLSAESKTLLQEIKAVFNKIAEKLTGQPIFLEDATAEDVLDFMVTISERMSKGQDISSFFRDVDQVTSTKGESRLSKQIGAKKKLEYAAKLAKERPDLEEQGLTEETISLIEQFGEENSQDGMGNPKLEKLAVHWIGRGNVKLPEDGFKIVDAEKLATKNKVDPFAFSNPIDIMEKFAGTIKEKPVDPDTVKEFSNKVSIPGTNVTVYNVEDTKEGQAAVRRIADTHWGKNWNGWCLISRTGKDKNLDTAWKLWSGTYNQMPKKIAFENGKIIAFQASKESNETWWDKSDKDYKGVPVKENLEDKKFVVNAMSEDGETISVSNTFRKANNKEEEWNKDGIMISDKTNDKDGKAVTEEKWYDNGDRKVKTYFADSARVLQLNFNNNKIADFSFELRDESRKFTDGDVEYEVSNKSYDNESGASVTSSTLLATNKEGELLQEKQKGTKTYSNSYGNVELKLTLEDNNITTFFSELKDETKKFSDGDLEYEISNESVVGKNYSLSDITKLLVSNKQGKVLQEQEQQTNYRDDSQYLENIESTKTVDGNGNIKTVTYNNDSANYRLPSVKSETVVDKNGIKRSETIFKTWDNESEVRQWDEKGKLTREDLTPYDINNFNFDFQKSKGGAGTLREVKPTDALRDIVKNNPQLSAIGTVEQYAKYLSSIFPNSLFKNIFYRGTPDSSMIEAEDLDPEKGIGAKNLGKGLYWTPNKKKSADYTSGDKGRISAAILDINNFHVVDIDTNWRRGYAGLKDLTVSEVTNGADAIVAYKGLDKDNYVDFKTEGENNTYIGEYVGPVDENGLPAYQKFNELTPEMDQLAVDSNAQVHILGSKKDVEGFKNFTLSKQMRPSNPAEEVRRIAQRYNMSNQGFAPSQINEFALDKELRPYGYSAKRAAPDGNGRQRGVYILNPKGRFFNPFKGKFQRINLGAGSLRENVDTIPGYQRMLDIVNGIIDKSLSRGRTQDEIMKSVMDYVTGPRNAVYTRANDSQREQLVRNIRSEFGKREKSAPSIGKLFDTIKDINMITMSEAELLKQQIRTLARGAKDAKMSWMAVSKEVAKQIKELVVSGKISNRQAASVISRLASVNMFNQDSIDKFAEYMTKVFNDANYDMKIQNARKKLPRALNNLKKKIGIANAVAPSLVQLFSINPNLIPDSVLERYLELVDMFGSSNSVLELDRIKTVELDVKEILDAVNEEVSLAEELALRFDEFVDKVYDEDGKLEYASTVDKMVKYEIITEEDAKLMRKYKKDILPKVEETPKTKAEIEEEKRDLIKAIKAITINTNDLPTRFERDLAKRLVELLKPELLKKMSVNQLNNVIKLIDNINNGYLPRYAQITVEKLNSIQYASKELVTAIQDAKPLRMSNLVGKVKSAFSGRSAALESIRRAPLFFIDQIFGDFKSKRIFNSVFGMMAAGQAAFTSTMNKVNQKIDNAHAAVAKSHNYNANKTLESSFRMMAYMIQLEYESNPGSKQVNTAASFINATIKHILNDKSKYKEADAALLENILDEYGFNGGVGKNGKPIREIDLDTLYASFNKAELDAIKTFREINDGITEKAQYTASVIRGESITPLNNYVHLPVLHDYNPNERSTGIQNADAYNNSRRPSSKAKNLEERSGDVSPINFDAFASVQRGAKFTLLDFHMTEAIRTSRKTINEAREQMENDGTLNKEKRQLLNAIERANEEVIKNVLTNNFITDSFLEAAVNEISKQGYRAILASGERFVSELTSNVGFVIFSDPKSFAKGISKKTRAIIMSPSAIDIMENVDSKQTARLFSGDALTGRLVDTSIMSQASGVRSTVTKNSFSNVSNIIYNHSLKWIKNSVETVSDTLISTPDKVVMRPVWFGAFANEFKNQTGEDVDFDKIAANNEAYMSQYKDAISKAKNIADEKSTLTGATDNPFMGILKGTVTADQGGLSRAFHNFNNFMTRFAIYEFSAARQGIYAAMGNGTLNRRQGAALLAGVVTRMTVYTLLTNVLGSLLLSLFGEDDEEKETEKSFMQKFEQALASTATSLLIGRDFGNSVKAISNVGVEKMNEEYFDFLRNGDYDPYEDAIVYSAMPKERKGHQTDLGDFLTVFTGSFTPLIKTGDLAIRKAFEDPKKTPAAIERQQAEIYERLPLEILGNMGLIPLYKDVRKVVVKKIYKSLEEEMRLEKISEKERAIEKEKLGKYETRTDMKRYDPELYRKTFGPGSPGYDADQEKKRLADERGDAKRAAKDAQFGYDENAIPTKEQMTPSQLKRYFPNEYNYKYGKFSPNYNQEQAEKDLENQRENEFQDRMDDYYNHPRENRTKKKKKRFES